MDLELHNIYHTIKDEHNNPSKIIELFRKFINIENFPEQGIRDYIIDNEFDYFDDPISTTNKIIEGYVDFAYEKRRYVDFINFGFDNKGEIINVKFTNKIEWKILSNYIIGKYGIYILDYLHKDTYSKIFGDLDKAIKELHRIKRHLENPNITKSEFDSLRIDNPNEVQADISILENWKDKILELNKERRTQ